MWQIQMVNGTPQALLQEGEMIWICWSEFFEMNIKVERDYKENGEETTRKMASVIRFKVVRALHLLDGEQMKSKKKDVLSNWSFHADQSYACW
jgi:hypothetical protein